MTAVIQYFNDKSQHVCRVLALWSRKTFKESNVVESNVGESWKQIPGYEGCYDVSSLGRVRSWSRYAHARSNSEYPKVLARIENSLGYAVVTLSKNNVQKRFLVSRLVLEAFAGPAQTPKHEAAHNDGNPRNNRLDNLRWATSKENQFDKVRHGTHHRGERNPSAKLTNTQAIEIFSMRNSNATQSAIAEKYGVSQSLVSGIFTGKVRGHITSLIKPEGK